MTIQGTEVLPNIGNPVHWGEGTMVAGVFAQTLLTGHSATPSVQHCRRTLGTAAGTITYAIAGTTLTLTSSDNTETSIVQFLMRG